MRKGKSETSGPEERRRERGTGKQTGGRQMDTTSAKKVSVASTPFASSATCSAMRTHLTTSVRRQPRGCCPTIIPSSRRWGRYSGASSWGHCSGAACVTNGNERRGGTVKQRGRVGVARGPLRRTTRRHKSTYSGSGGFPTLDRRTLPAPSGRREMPS